MTTIKPMLAGKCNDVNALTYPVLASPKLDGIRALVYGGRVLSRKLEPIPNHYIQRVLGKRKYDGLDGELIVGDATNAFLAATTGIMRFEGEPAFTFYVFDDYRAPGTPFKHRYQHVIDRTMAAPPHIQHVPHMLIRSAEELLKMEAVCLEQGYEGVMIRSPNGRYKFGRSTALEGDLLKLKRFEDGEAYIIGFEELEHNENEATVSKLGTVKRSSAKAGRVGGNMLGAFVVRDCKTGVEFNIGSGFTEEQRIRFWEIREKLKGKIVKYKFFPTGSKEKPRFPTFIGFRDPRDL